MNSFKHKIGHICASKGQSSVAIASFVGSLHSSEIEHDNTSQIQRVPNELQKEGKINKITRYISYWERNQDYTLYNINRKNNKSPNRRQK